MAQQITAEYFREHRAQLADARHIVANEFRGLDAHDQYYNAFARVLKRDPLGRVTMLGTDQRDRFVPEIRALLQSMDAPRRVLDVGCGDGQTFALLADAIAPGATIDLIDPNADYVRAYAERVAAMPGLEAGRTLALPFAPDPQNALLAPSYDLILAIHSLYFFEDLGACLADLHSRLAAGGTAILVFADESVSFTGVCFRAYLRHIGRDDLAQAHEALCAERLAWLYGAAPLASERLPPPLKIHAVAQQTRLFGHSLADMIALCNIAGLSLHDDPAKFDVAASVLEHQPESVGFRVEGEPDSRRLGMFSVLQPQIVCAIRKLD